MNAPNRERPRRSVESIYKEMGDKRFRSAFKMTYADFQQLCELLDPELNALAGRPGRLPRDVVENSIRVACSLRYFAGGDPFDIAGVYGISHSAFNDSLAMVIQAINQCDHDA